MRILVALDSSEASQRAIEFVTRHFDGQDVHSVTAQGLREVPPVYAAGAPTTVALSGQPMMETYEIGADGTPQGDPLSFDANIANALIEAAEVLDVDLIVVGSGDRNFLERIFTGSVSDNVVQKADRPVLVVK